MQSDKMAEKKSKKKASEKVTVRWLLWNFFNLIRRFGSPILWIGFLVYLVRCAKEVFIAYSGKTSVANMSFLANFNVAVTLSLVATGITGFLYVREFSRHRKS